MTNNKGSIQDWEKEGLRQAKEINNTLSRGASEEFLRARGGGGGLFGETTKIGRTSGASTIRARGRRE